MIVYIGRKQDKVTLVKLQVTDDPNKISIPKSIITKSGIFDLNTTEEEKAYIFSIEIESYKDTAKLTHFVDTTLSMLGDGDIVYVIDLETKKLISYLELHKQYKVFRKYTGVGTTFMDSFFAEMSIMTRNIYGVTKFDIEKYMKSKIVLHPLLNTRQLFFYKQMPEGYYYSYQNKENIKKDAINPDSIDITKTKLVLGKKTSTNVYQVFHIEKQEYLDSLYEEWRKHTEVNLYAIMLLYRLSNPNNIYYRDINKLIKKKDPIRLETPKKDVLISEIKPAALAYYAHIRFSDMKSLLDAFNNDKDSIAYRSTVDITNLIYDEKHDILSPNDFNVEYFYKLNDSEYKIIITTGLDLPTRNALKSIGKNKPSVYLMMINENNICLRYYTIVKYNKESLLTANYPANLVLLEDK